MVSLTFLSWGASGGYPTFRVILTVIPTSAEGTPCLGLLVDPSEKEAFAHLKQYAKLSPASDLGSVCFNYVPFPDAHLESRCVPNRTSVSLASREPPSLPPHPNLAFNCAPTLKKPLH